LGFGIADLKARPGTSDEEYRKAVTKGKKSEIGDPQSKIEICHVH
jgi:hypothetical protein